MCTELDPDRIVAVPAISVSLNVTLSSNVTDDWNITDLTKVTISENVVVTWIMRESSAPMIASRRDWSSDDIGFPIIEVVAPVLFVVVTWDLIAARSLERVLILLLSELTVPESVFTLVTIALTAAPNPVSPHELKFGSIFPRDLFTINENRSSGERISPKILPLWIELTKELYSASLTPSK